MMFKREPDPSPVDAFERLTRRIEDLEGRCEALAKSLLERDDVVKQLRLDQLVLQKRFDESAVQTAKATRGLLERVEAVRHAGGAGLAGLQTPNEPMRGL